jgi:hypothetical protein
MGKPEERRITFSNNSIPSVDILFWILGMRPSESTFHKGIAFEQSSSSGLPIFLASSSPEKESFPNFPNFPNFRIFLITQTASRL